MKAIVLGVKNGRAALLLEDGTTAYRYMKCRPGQRVEVPEQAGVVRSMPRAVRTAAAAAAFALMISGGILYATAMPVSYVTEDVNPSMEYSLNRMDRVIGVSALNEDAKSIVEDLGVSGGTIQTAVDIAGRRMEEKGILDEDGYVLFSVTSDNDQRAQRLENVLSDMMDGDGGLTFSVLRVSEDEHREARKLDMSAGRYKEMLNTEGKTAISDKKLISEFQHKPVREMLGGADDEKKADADIVQPVSGQNSTEQNAKPTKGSGEKTKESTTDTKQSVEKEETRSAGQERQTTKPSPSVQSPPASLPAAAPQPAAPAQQTQPPQPQQNDGGVNHAPSEEPQPTEVPAEVKKKETSNKTEPKQESDRPDPVEQEKEAEPPSGDHEAGGGPMGGGEPPSGGGGGPAGPP